MVKISSIWGQYLKTSSVRIPKTVGEGADNSFCILKKITQYKDHYWYISPLRMQNCLDQQILGNSESMSTPHAWKSEDHTDTTAMMAMTTELNTQACYLQAWKSEDHTDTTTMMTMTTELNTQACYLQAWKSEDHTDTTAMMAMTTELNTQACYLQAWKSEDHTDTTAMMAMTTELNTQACYLQGLSDPAPAISEGWDVWYHTQHALVRPATHNAVVVSANHACYGQYSLYTSPNQSYNAVFTSPVRPASNKTICLSPPTICSTVQSLCPPPFPCSPPPYSFYISTQFFFISPPTSPFHPPNFLPTCHTKQSSHPLIRPAKHKTLCILLQSCLPHTHTRDLQALITSVTHNIVDSVTRSEANNSLYTLISLITVGGFSVMLVKTWLATDRSRLTPLHETGNHTIV